MSGPLDEPRLAAAVDMIGRCGARDLEIGYDGPEDDPRWYAQATIRANVPGNAAGRTARVDGFGLPEFAAEGLARSLINGGTCTHCRRKVILGGSTGGGFCRYRRDGNRWVRGCAKRD